MDNQHYDFDDFANDVSQEESLFSDLDPSIGDNYEIIDRLGHGGMGEVFKILNKPLQRVEALKVLKLEQNEKTNIERFYKEAQAIAGLKRNNPQLNIPEVFEFKKGTKNFYYTMEYIEGSSLEKVMMDETLDTEQAVAITIVLAQTLQGAHAKGIVHRDIKPANIILDSSRSPWLVDFGIVKEMQNENKMTEDGVVIGTPLHMSPEQIQGHSVDPKSDIYALGTVFYQMLAAQPLVCANSIEEVVYQIVHKTPEPPSHHREAVNKELDYICLKMLEKDPGQRYQNATKVVSELENYLNPPKILAKDKKATRKMATKTKEPKIVEKNKNIDLKIVGIFLLVLLLLFFLHDKYSSSNKIREKQSEKQNISRATLRIMAWKGYVRPYIQDFKKHIHDTLHIDVEIIVEDASGREQFIDGINNKKVDLVSPANDLLVALQNKKLIRPLDISKIKNFSQIHPVIRQTRFYEIQNKSYAIPFAFGCYALAYNKDKMTTPKSYKKLWDKKYSGRVSISNYDTANIYMVALMLQMHKDLFNLNPAQLKQIGNKIQELHSQQIYKYWKHNLNPEYHQKIDIGMDWGIGVNKINQTKGGNWGIAIPEEGATTWIDCWAVAFDIDPNKMKLAYAFIDFMLSDIIQAKVVRNTTYAPVNFQAIRYFTGEESIVTHIADLNNKLSNRKLVLWKFLNQKTLRLYQDTWKRAIGK